ncbi:hypothetical protein CDD83_4390 [Cordyceps sp. RAO-2017]|nr:hypothetical protein CDD83_4390 [Cordyceps sp. RAO-2017]
MDSSLPIGNVVERDTAIKPAEFPAVPTPSTGFPQHKPRWRSLTFKQQTRATSDGAIGAPADSIGRPQEAANSPLKPSQQRSFADIERRQIDQENRLKIARMTPKEIAQAQEDITQGLDPALIQRLLQRANIDEENGPSPFDRPAMEHSDGTIAPPELNATDASSSSSPAPTSHRPISIENAPASVAGMAGDGYDGNRAPAQIPSDLFPITDQPKSTHFPVPPPLPDLDPSNPDFLATLHEKYFPNLPADPSKLAWMAPLPSRDSPADKESPYYPHPEIGVSALRFDFRGRFLSPRVSRSIPSTKGLHHHGEAPEAAGYTVTELARLARSAVPAQRCMAYQTLGRILYRLGRGEWGKTHDDPIAMGVWASIKQGRALESLVEAASGEGGHRGSRAYATEALWLFEKGGWKETFKGR